MRIRKQLLVEHSRANADKIETMVLADDQLLPELMACFFSDETVVAQRAAQVVGDIGRKESDRLLPWLAEIVDAIENPVHEAIRRNGVRYFSELDEPLSPELESRLMRLCLAFVGDSDTKTAVGAFAMQFVADRAEQYPADAEVLCNQLRARMPSATAGFKNRAKKILKKLEARL